MALRLIDGFDFYATADIGSRWPYNAGCTIQSSSGRFTGGCIQIGQYGSNYAKIIFPDNQSTWIVGGAYKQTNFPTTGSAHILYRIMDGSTCQVDLRMSPAGVLYVTRNGTTIATGTTVLTVGAYYYLELKAVISGTTGSVGVQIGGVSEISATGVNTSASGNAYAQAIELGASSGQDTNITYVDIDDVYICDGTGSINNTFLGDVRVEALRPAAAGSVTQFSLSGASANYAAVNQAAEDGDTSYVSSASINQVDTYTYGALSSTPANVFAVQLTLVARKDDAGSRAITTAVKVAGTLYAGASHSLPDSYTYFADIYPQNPGTSAAWTPSDISAFEGGMKLTG